MLAFAFNAANQVKMAGENVLAPETNSNILWYPMLRNTASGQEIGLPGQEDIVAEVLATLRPERRKPGRGLGISPRAGIGPLSAGYFATEAGGWIAVARVVPPRS